MRIKLTKHSYNLNLPREKIDNITKKIEKLQRDQPYNDKNSHADKEQG